MNAEGLEVENDGWILPNQMFVICFATWSPLMVGFQEMQSEVKLLVDLDLDKCFELIVLEEELFAISHRLSTPSMSSNLPLLRTNPMTCVQIQTQTQT